MPGAGSAPTGSFLRSHRVSAARYRDGYSKYSGQRQFEKARFRSPAMQRLRRLADNGSVATFVPRTPPGALAAPDAASSLAHPTRDRQSLPGPYTAGIMPLDLSDDEKPCFATNADGRGLAAMTATCRRSRSETNPGRRS